MNPDRAWIAAHIPHQGSMCLLDEVVAWDARRIDCRSLRHGEPDHPLRARGRLGAAAAIEYGAQAAAVHGALLAAGPPETLHLLASVRDLELHTARLDDVGAELRVGAERLHGDARGALYGFEIVSGARVLARGRLSLLRAAAPAPGAPNAPPGAEPSA